LAADTAGGFPGQFNKDQNWNGCEEV